MWLDQESLRFIFGLKLRALRQTKALSLKDLSKASGLSPSYLNEIEKGKKYPKTDKILQLAKSLDVPYDQLISLKLDDELNQLSKLLKTNALNGLPLEVFGLPAQTIFELVAENPQEISALIGTTMELARNHGITVDDFLFATLRAHINMKGNYFLELEEAAEALATKLKLPKELSARKAALTPDFLKNTLMKDFSCEVIERSFTELSPEMSEIYFFSDPQSKVDRLYLNRSMSSDEKVFILTREMARRHLKFADWVPYSLISGFTSYQQLLNYFRSSYFAGAFLMPADRMVASVKKLLQSKDWSSEGFLSELDKFPGTPKNYFHRLTQILPKHFDLENLFYFRAQFDSADGVFQLIKETHLSDLHTPHRTSSTQHYCRRWITTSLIEQQRKNLEKPLAGTQVSSFVGTQDSFLCFALAFPSSLVDTRTECVTVGIRLDEGLKEKLPVLKSANMVHREVSQTCETCVLTDCESRIAPATDLAVQQKHEKIEKLIRNIVH